MANKTVKAALEFDAVESFKVCLKNRQSFFGRIIRANNDLLVTTATNKKGTKAEMVK